MCMCMCFMRAMCVCVCVCVCVHICAYLHTYTHAHFPIARYEFVDTLIMVAKKNNHQISFLHVYHHVSTLKTIHCKY